MGDKSAIEWTDATWPIVQGCDPLSQGCAKCYAVPLLWRLSHNPDPKVSGPLQGLTEKHVNAAGESILRFTGKLALRHDRLDWPLKWKKPRMIFVPSHGDIFHKDVPDGFLDRIFAAMALSPQHTFQVLTKRAERMREYVARYDTPMAMWVAAGEIINQMAVAADIGERYVLKVDRAARRGWPLPNVWLGVSCEDQANACERIPHLLQTPAAVRFLSCEPLLGPIDLTNLCNGHWFCDALTGARWHDGEGGAHDTIGKVSWVIVGGESGKTARPFDIDWARSILRQCDRADVRAFMKQLGSNPHSDGRPMHAAPRGKYGEPSEWPPELRVREFPRAA